MLAKLLYSHSRYLWLTVVVILMVGVASMRSLGRQEDPTITNFFATVTTFFPGAEPARVEALVSKPIEQELRGIAEVDEVKSTSSTGVSSIILELYDTLQADEIERAWSEVRDALDDASRQFPQGVNSPVFDNDRTTAYVRIIAVTSAPGYELSVPLLSRSAEDLAERARNFSGTQFVDIYGEASEEIRVDVDEQAMLARGIGIAELTQALRGADPRRASGRASGNTNDLLIEIDGEFDSAARVANVIVRTDRSSNSVSVGDIGRVYRAEQTPPIAMAMTDGRRGILLGIAMNDGLQVDRWSQDFEVFLDAYRAQAPAGIQISSSYNQATYTEARLRDV